MLPVLAAQVEQQVELAGVRSAPRRSRPRLYWSGRDVDAIPFDELPDDYVIRLTSGHSSEQVVVLRAGVDLLTGTRYDRARVREHFATLLAAAFSRTLMLVEEYIPPFDTDEPSGLPVNYRFHMFGDVVAWISASCARRNYGHFSAGWEPLSIRVARDGRLPYPWPRPVGLDRMLEAARTLARAFESYIRVDLYDAEGGRSSRSSPRSPVVADCTPTRRTSSSSASGPRSSRTPSNASRSRAIVAGRWNVSGAATRTRERTSCGSPVRWPSRPADGCVLAGNEGGHRTIKWPPFE